MPEMVWCQSCKKVIWAYDHQDRIDLRGMCNMLRLPCPECGNPGNFDGWGCRTGDMEDIVASIASNGDEPPYDGWSLLRYIAGLNNMEWAPSPNCTWFKRPDGTNLTEHLAGVISALRKE